MGLFHVILNTARAHWSRGGGEGLKFGKAAFDEREPWCSPLTISRLWCGAAGLAGILCMGMLGVSMCAHTHMCTMWLPVCIHVHMHVYMGAPVCVGMCTQLASEGVDLWNVHVNEPIALAPGVPFAVGNLAPFLRSASRPPGQLHSQRGTFAAAS